MFAQHKDAVRTTPLLKVSLYCQRSSAVNGGDGVKRGGSGEERRGGLKMEDLGGDFCVCSLYISCIIQPSKANPILLHPKTRQAWMRLLLRIIFFAVIFMRKLNITWALGLDHCANCCFYPREHLPHPPLLFSCVLKAEEGRKEGEEEEKGVRFRKQNERGLR